MGRETNVIGCHEVYLDPVDMGRETNVMGCHEVYLDRVVSKYQEGEK
jgi:hypothetical protein